MQVSNAGSSTASQVASVKPAPKTSSTEEAAESARAEATEQQEVPKATAKQPGVGDQVDMSA